MIICGNLIKSNMKSQYQCEICNKFYNTPELALACEASSETPIVNVGDIVFLVAGFTWFTGDINWVSNPTVDLRGIASHGNCFSDCCTYKFYYVVTAITNEKWPNPHKLHYHVVTNAMIDNGYHSGFTTVNHYKPKLVENPPLLVVEESKQFIGLTSGLLL